jgi:hypothetical protein
MTATALARQLLKRPLHLLLATCLLGTLLSIGVEIVSLPKPAAARTTALGYTAITPCRVADTRLDARGRFIQNGASRDLQVTGTGQQFEAQGGAAPSCGIPAGTIAVELSITLIGPSGNGFVRAFPHTQSAPNATYTLAHRALTASGAGEAVLTAKLVMSSFLTVTLRYQ